MYLAYAPDSKEKQVGTTVQLFIDDDVVAVLKNVTRTSHQPDKHPASPLIKRDQPWGVLPMFRSPTYSVAHDPRDGLFKCWHEDYSLAFATPRSWNKSRLHYAQSVDGLTWEKPGFDKLVIDGQRTNAVFSTSADQWASCNSVLLDVWDPDPVRRYKTVCDRIVEEAPTAVRTERGPTSGGYAWRSHPTASTGRRMRGTPCCPGAATSRCLPTIPSTAGTCSTAATGPTRTKVRTRSSTTGSRRSFQGSRRAYGARGVASGAWSARTACAGPTHAWCSTLALMTTLTMPCTASRPGAPGTCTWARCAS
ncbi:MAG: hypothetical protein FJ029_00870 [Actinobacteria bacterium]|nr:hypothetical protein [Actinomycetota bacterium]